MTDRGAKRFMTAVTAVAAIGCVIAIFRPWGFAISIAAVFVAIFWFIWAT